MNAGIEEKVGVTRGKIIILIAAVMLIGAGVAAVLLRDGNFVSQQPGHGYEMMENKEIKELPDETKSDPEPPVNVTHEQPEGNNSTGDRTTVHGDTCNQPEGDNDPANRPEGDKDAKNRHAENDEAKDTGDQSAVDKDAENQPAENDEIKNTEKEVVVFKDKDLEEYVRMEARKETGDLYYSDLEEVTELYIIFWPVDCYEDLVLLPNLRWLEIAMPIDAGDLGAIGKLETLERLALWNCGINDISALDGLTGLKRLDIQQNGSQLSDISALSGLMNLKELNLSKKTR
jgi:hypothetical protein